MKKSVVNPVTARCVGTIKVVALKGLRRRGWWNMTSWWIGWGGDLGSCWLDNASGSTTNKAIIVSNWKGFSSQGFGSTLYLFWGTNNGNLPGKVDLNLHFIKAFRQGRNEWTMLCAAKNNGKKRRPTSNKKDVQGGNRCFLLQIGLIFEETSWLTWSLAQVSQNEISPKESLLRKHLAHHHQRHHSAPELLASQVNIWSGG